MLLHVVGHRCRVLICPTCMLHMQTVLVPGPEIGTDVGALGLFVPGESVAAGQAFGWELIMTFILVC